MLEFKACLILVAAQPMYLLGNIRQVILGVLSTVGQLLDVNPPLANMNLCFHCFPPLQSLIYDSFSTLFSRWLAELILFCPIAAATPPPTLKMPAGMATPR